MKRQLLQLLHPLQVVELPREGPDAALHFFAPLSDRARCLVIGGDGTVSWVLSAIDELKTELDKAGGVGGAGGAGARGNDGGFCGGPSGADSVSGGGPGAGPEGWCAPPLAVFPMGTGNDLARCLRWGGSITTLGHSPLPVLLDEVADALPARLDRWEVRIRDPPRPRRAGGGMRHRIKR
eukprot:277183-Chlamydomonas_euryale.AAC.1